MKKVFVTSSFFLLVSFLMAQISIKDDSISISGEEIEQQIHPIIPIIFKQGIDSIQRPIEITFIQESFPKSIIYSPHNHETIIKIKSVQGYPIKTTEVSDRKNYEITISIQENSPSSIGIEIPQGLNEGILIGIPVNAVTPMSITKYKPTIQDPPGYSIIINPPLIGGTTDISAIGQGISINMSKFK